MELQNIKATHVIQCGCAEDIPVVANYMGDGQRVAVFRPSSGMWYIKGHDLEHWGAGETHEFQCGCHEDIPFAADFFGDGVRACVWRPSEGNFYVKGPGLKSWGNGNDIVMQCGTKGDIPFVGDFFGEGVARVGVFRPSEGNFYIKGLGQKSWADGPTENKGNVVFQCGCHEDIPVMGNLVGDGFRFGVFRPSEGNWYVKGHGIKSWGNGGDVVMQCGTQGDIPLVANVYGDGVRCIVYRPSEGNWYVKGKGDRSWGADGNDRQHQWGEAGGADKPLTMQTTHGHEVAVSFRPSEGNWYIQKLPKH